MPFPSFACVIHTDSLYHDSLFTDGAVDPTQSPSDQRWNQRAYEYGDKVTKKDEEDLLQAREKAVADLFLTLVTNNI